MSFIKQEVIDSTVENNPSTIEATTTRSPFHFDTSTSSSLSSTKSSVKTSTTTSVAAYRCGLCIACLRPADCRKCENCLKEVQPCNRRVCVQAAMIKQEHMDCIQQPNRGVAKTKPKVISDPQSPKKNKRGRPRKNPLAPVIVKTDSTSKEPKAKVARRLTKKSMVSSTKQEIMRRSISNVVEKKEPRQCYGPHCTRCARRGSKYCSDMCGSALAQQRLQTLLPIRLKQYYAERPLSEVTSDQRLFDLIKKRTEIEEQLKVADKYRTNMDCYIAALAHASPSASEKLKVSNGGDSCLCYCFVCGSEATIGTIGKHIMRCFERLEKQTTFGTSNKLRINPYDILCEAFDKHSKTYCKRLRVVCPEHYKDDIGKKMKVCGYPLRWEKCDLNSAEEMLGNNVQLLDDSMCLQPRKHCSEHKSWERNVFAMIDNLRMSYLLKIDEICDNYRRIAMACHSHSNAVFHLLSSTISHDSNLDVDNENVQVIMENLPKNNIDIMT
ncbi:CXXC-type zinc finger protein 1 [Aphelenchoides besseyi]|nr:CXXC-type zinc finger protein 1 [Aphelenchoides besseyi]